MYVCMFLSLVLQATHTKLGLCVDHHYHHNVCRYGYRLLIENSCADVLQPDITWIGGITEVCVHVQQIAKVKLNSEKPQLICCA